VSGVRGNQLFGFVGGSDGEADGVAAGEKDIEDVGGDEAGGTWGC
jgi:hypothetical protein